MARGILYNLGADYNPPIVAFCKANPLPPNAMSVSPVDVINTGFTFGEMLKAIIKTKATDLMLVVHGHIDGSGLYLPVASGAQDVLGRHLKILMDIATSGKDPTDRQASEFGSNGKQIISDLIDLMKKIRDAKLNTVEWRACDLGSKPGVLMQFRDFFGAKVMGAPKVANNFGFAPIYIRPFDKIPEQFRDFQTYYYPDRHNTKIYYFLKLDSSTGWPVKGAIFAEKKDDVKDFIQQKINPRGAVPDGPLAMHHLWKDPDSSHALDPPTPILPLESEYAANIEYAKGP